MMIKKGFFVTSALASWLLIGSSVVANAQASSGPGTPTQVVSPASASVTTSAESAASKTDGTTTQIATNGEKVICRNAAVTGSRLQRKKVCSSDSTEQGASDWAREQQAKGGMAASANLNGGG